MTEDELWDEIRQIENDYASISSKKGSDNVSDIEEETEDGTQSNHFNSNTHTQVVLSGSDNEYDIEWDADDTVPQAQLGHYYKKYTNNLGSSTK